MNNFYTSLHKNTTDSSKWRSETFPRQSRASHGIEDADFKAYIDRPLIKKQTL